MPRARTAAAQTRFDTAKKLPALLRTIEKIAEEWDADTDEAGYPGTDAAGLLTDVVQAWRTFTSPQP